MTLYNKRLTAELEEVLFIPWRTCAFGLDVIHKLCEQQLEESGEKLSCSEPSSPKLIHNVHSQGTFSTLLETATKGS